MIFLPYFFFIVLKLEMCFLNDLKKLLIQQRQQWIYEYFKCHNKQNKYFTRFEIKICFNIESIVIEFGWILNLITRRIGKMGGKT